MNELNALKHALTPKILGGLIWLSVFSFAVDKCYRNNIETLDKKLKSHSDSEGYYQYLPTLVSDTLFTQMSYTHHLENGNHLNFFMIGVAVMQSPFFAGVLAYTHVTDIENVDLYGKEFFIGMAVANAFYTATAFLLLFLCLFKRLGKAATLIALAAIYFGTNVVFYSARDPITSHLFAFFLVSALMYLGTQNRFEGFRKRRVFWIVICGGLLTLVRIPHILLVGIPFLLWLERPKDVIARVQDFLSARKEIIGGVLIIGSLWALQSAYWHAVTGKWFVSTYSYKGEGFNWTDPHLFDVLFSHQNGFFIYAPLMFVPVVWALERFLFHRDLTNGVIFGYFSFITVLYGFWWCWWLGGSYGHRGFVDILPLLSVPLAQVVSKVRTQQTPLKVTLGLLTFMLVLTNYHMSVIYGWPWEGESWTWHDVVEKYTIALSNPWRI